MMPVLSARRLTKGAGRTPAVADIDLDVAPGECVGITGSAGSGRTTVLRLLGTLLAPAAGELQVDGIDAVRRVDAARRRLVLAGAALPAAHRLRVDEYVRFCRDARRRGGAAPEAVRKAVALAGLDEQADVMSLSPTARRDLAIAVALATDAAVVLIDGAGDAAGRSTPVAASIAELRRRGAAIVVSVEAEDAELRSACQRLFRLQGGRLLSEASAAVAIESTAGGI